MSARSSADGELAGLRDYVPGDPIQRVAWKSVARGAGWYTKEFDGTGGGAQRQQMDTGRVGAALPVGTGDAATAQVPGVTT